MRSLSPNICYPSHQNNRLSPPESTWVVPKTPFKVIYLRDQLRSAMVTLDTNFMATLCRRESISLIELTDSFRDKLLFERKDAIYLARYLTERQSTSPKVGSPVSKSISPETLEFKIRRFVGEYEHINYDPQTFVDHYKTSSNIEICAKLSSL